MKVLFWLSLQLDQPSTSSHLISAMIKQVKNLGCDICIICKKTKFENKSDIEHIEKKGVKIVSIPYNSPPKNKFAFRYIAELKYIFQCRKEINTKFDAIFIQSSIAAGFLVNIARKKCPDSKITYNVQDVYPYDVMYAGKIKKYNPLFITMALIQKYAYSRSDSIITISEDMKDMLVEAGAKDSKISVIYNWSYRDQIYDDSDVSLTIKNMFDDSYFNIVYAGNLGLFQNVEVVIDAASKLKGNKDIWFHIFGDGIYKKFLEKRSQEYKIHNITFHSVQPHDLAPSVYRCASLNIIPLGKNQFRTALPSKTATCLACQKPIIFVIGEKSKFGQKLKKETNCPLLNSEDIDLLVNNILKIKNKEIETATKNYYLTNFSVTKNSFEYAKIITGDAE